jgi:2,3-bisphosphoglycerate-independent phosphoglycerate mutase
MEPSIFPDSLVTASDSRILLCVLDGLGDLPGPGRAETPLEAARTPELDRVAPASTFGLLETVAAGVTPGSGPGHLSLFGYAPERYTVGRGVLSALGVDFPLQPGDVAARFNFCTLRDGVITDRRAGRIGTDVNRRLVARLRSLRAPGDVQLFWETEAEHRGLLVARGRDLSAQLTDSDPQVLGRPPLEVKASHRAGETSAHLFNQILKGATDLLAGEHPANGLLVRGFASLPDWPSFDSRYGLRSQAIAKYPMYRGVARLVGMNVLEPYGDLPEAVKRLRSCWAAGQFFFLHFKDTDKAGEDGDFDRKVEAIERFDRIVPDLLALGPDVLAVTGDHSTPVAMKGHSWHPVPALLWAPKTVRPDRLSHFGESACRTGGLGLRPMSQFMSLLLAHAGRLTKFGA